MKTKLIILLLFVSAICLGQGISLDPPVPRAMDAVGSSSEVFRIITPAGDSLSLEVRSDSSWSVITSSTGVLVLNGAVVSGGIISHALKANSLNDGSGNFRNGAYLMARANHTGVQAISTITDLSTYLDSIGINEAAISAISARLIADSTNLADNYYNKTVTDGLLLAKEDTGNLSGKVDRSEWLQNGIVDRSESALSFRNSNRYFKISVVGASYKYLDEGLTYEVTADDSIQITDTEGLWYFYYEGTTLTSVNNPSHSQIENAIMNTCLLGVVYWDAVNNLGILQDERHGCNQAPATHRLRHETVGASYPKDGGLGVSDFVVGNGNDNEDAQFSIGSGEIYDEDLPLDINAINKTTGTLIYYRVGANWRWTTQTGFKCMTFDGTSATRLAYDNAGTLTQVADNDFVLIHIFATNNYDGNPITIIGQNEYPTRNAARDGIDVEIDNLVLGILPSNEMKPLHSIILQSKTSYTNAVNAKVVLVEAGVYTRDWRLSGTTSGIGTVGHGAQGGLLNDDHTQYALLAGRSGGQTLIGGTDANDTLMLKATSSTTGGFIYTEDSVIIGNFLGIGTVPILALDIAGTSSATSTVRIGRFSDNAYGGYVDFYKSRNTTIWGHTVVETNDAIGMARLYGSDGDSWELGASIYGSVTGTPSNGIMPFSWRFTTTNTSGSNATTVIFRENGQVGIGALNPYAHLDVSHELNAINSTGDSAIMANMNLRLMNSNGSTGDASGISWGCSGVEGNPGGAAIFGERTGGNAQMDLHFATKVTTTADSKIPIRMTILNDGGLKLYFIKSGINQGAAGAAANEVWVDTNDDYTLKLGQ